ncbi:substrate-binding domain-containing protein [Methylocapsa sp. S129]|uniref:substrate-binding domain-containing protein n=1 Tax=Methylocapsa sp. S129 TaxID=1641869 RepID=UPI00131B9122|nr:substrate-binding domain-containing protein [Methylocapsa sp. S129]
MFKSTHSLLLAGVSRRSFLKTSAALGLGAVASPAIVSQALSSSGELSILNWDDELPDPVIPDFEKATGIKVNSTPFSQNEEQINKLQATDGAGFDLCQPTHDRAPQFKDIGVLQPLDDKRVKLDLIVPSLLKASAANWTWDGKLYHVPHCWGTEAISWRNDLTKIAPDELSFGTLWNDEYKGKVQGRPHSLLLGIGLWLDGTGKLPTNRMLDAFKNEDQMKKIYDVLLKEAIDRKAWIKQFWDSADNTKSGLISNGVVIGQTWDGPVISLKKSGKPISYQAPKEGAIGWVDGWSLSKASKNVEQAYAFLNYLHSPEGAAKVAEGSGYNPSGIGADKLLSDKARGIFSEAYPGASIDKMWWRPVEPSWFAELRSQYAEKYKAA